MAHSLDDVRQLLRDTRWNLLQKPNVVATGVGYKVTEGTKTDDISIICSVGLKKARSSLTPREMIPAEIQGIPTDVYPSGTLYALQDPKDRFRPAPGGVSIGHFQITAGTFGCLVEKDGKLYILSNNHVLANSNDASTGDLILQPGPYDGGSSANDRIGTLADFVPILFEGEDSDCAIGSGAAGMLNAAAKLIGSRTRLTPVRTQVQENLVDAALALPDDENDVSQDILNIGNISGTAEGDLGMTVKKSGRTTGFTTGTIEQIDVTSRVNYGSDRVATFVDQLMAGNMSQGGDSGSAVLNDENKLVGLLFAGSNTSTIINRIQNVFQALQVDLP